MWAKIKSLYVVMVDKPFSLRDIKLVLFNLCKINEYSGTYTYIQKKKKKPDEARQIFPITFCYIYEKNLINCARKNPPLPHWTCTFRIFMSEV